MALQTTPITWEGSTLFTRQELACPETGEIRLNSIFARRLRMVRIELGFPMPVTSACRSKAYNTLIRGHPRSLHVYDEPYHPIEGCAAVDVAISHLNLRQLSRLIWVAKELSFSVGLNEAKFFMHLDGRTLIGMPQKMFFYDKEPIKWARNSMAQLASTST